MLPLGNEGKLILYSKINYDMINMGAIFSDETENFRTPSESDFHEPVEVKIRTAKNNIDDVYIHVKEDVFQVQKAYQEGIFDYYSFVIPGELLSGRLEYYFELIKNEKSYYYNKKGLSYEHDNNYNFFILPGFKTPDWVKGSVMYQIYVDRFYNGDVSNDVVDNEYIYLGRASKRVANWEEPVANNDVGNFYGGDLQGIIEKMDYLKDLGVDVIYLNPIFTSPSNHKYDIQDYDYVDPHYGVIIEDINEPLTYEKFHNKYATMYVKRTTTIANLEASNLLMIKLISLAHEKGMKVILDGVFNHCGAFNKWLDKEGFYSSQKEYSVGAYRQKDSKYHDYFTWYEQDNWPNNDCYDSWWGFDNHPKLNFEGSRELYDYIIGIGKKWVSEPYNVDGWRLDVAADLGYSKEVNHQFWRDFRTAVKEANPEAIILAEHYGDPSEWLQGDQWDTVMNYDAFMEPITWFLTGMEKHSEEFKQDMLCNAQAFENSMRYFMARFSIQSLQMAMNELSNHDHSRFLTRTNMTPGRLHTKGFEAAGYDVNRGIMKEAVTFQMTWPGAPTIYYGDEAGVLGWTDPDNRRTYPWNREDQKLLSFHKEMIRIHKENRCLRTGSLEYLVIDYGVLSFGRWNKDEKIVVILNNNSDEQVIKVPIWKIGAEIDAFFTRLIYSDQHNFECDNRAFQAVEGVLTVKVSAFGSMVLKADS